MKSFKSFLAPQLKAFLAYRENLGYAMRPYRFFLLMFDDYMIEAGANKNSLVPEFFLNMRANLKMEPRSVNRIISTVRMFFRYMVRCGYYIENPLKDIPLLDHNFS